MIQAPQPVFGAESLSYSAASHSRNQDHTPLVLSQNVRHNDRHMDSIEVVSAGGKKRGRGAGQVGCHSCSAFGGRSGVAGRRGRGYGVAASHCPQAAFGAGDASPRVEAGWAVRARAEVARVGRQGCRGWACGAVAAGARRVARREWGEHAALCEGGGSQGLRGVRGAGDGVEGLRARGCGHAALAGVCGEGVLAFAPGGVDDRPDAPELRGIRVRGWAQSVAEREAGVASVSAPVFGEDGRLRAAASISGPISRLTGNPSQQLSHLVVEAAREIERTSQPVGRHMPTRRYDADPAPLRQGAGTSGELGGPWRVR